MPKERRRCELSAIEKGKHYFIEWNLTHDFIEFEYAVYEFQVGNALSDLDSFQQSMGNFEDYSN